jgi:hypothetical protein
MRRIKNSWTRVGYVNGGSVSNSNSIIVPKWFLNVEVVNIMSDVCIGCTISIPLLIIVDWVFNHSLQLGGWSPTLERIVHLVKTVKGLMWCLATYLTSRPGSSVERRSEICCCLWPWRGVTCWMRVSWGMRNNIVPESWSNSIKSGSKVPRIRPWSLMSMVSGMRRSWSLLLIKQSIGANIHTLGLLLLKQHFVIQQLILKILKVELFVMGHDGYSGDKAVKERT